MVATCGLVSDLRPSVRISRSGAVAVAVAGGFCGRGGVEVTQSRNAHTARWMLRGMRLVYRKLPRRLQSLEALLNRYGFGQVAWLIYVATTADGYVIGEELQRDDFQQRSEKLRRSGHF